MNESSNWTHETKPNELNKAWSSVKIVTKIKPTTNFYIFQLPFSYYLSDDMFTTGPYILWSREIIVKIACFILFLEVYGINIRFYCNSRGFDSLVWVYLVCRYQLPVKYNGPLVWYRSSIVLYRSGVIR